MMAKDHWHRFTRRSTVAEVTPFSLYLRDVDGDTRAQGK